MITCENITKSFGEKKVIKSFTFSFEPDKAYALVGANGAGKTTLLKILGGLLDCDSGFVKGECSKGWFAFRSISLMDRLKGSELINVMNAQLGSSLSASDLALRRSQWSELESFSQMLITEVGLCSQGMKALLGLFISTLSNPEVLLWDEPFSCLSPVNQTILTKKWAMFTGAKSLIVTHHGVECIGFTEIQI